MKKITKLIMITCFVLFSWQGSAQNDTCALAATLQLDANCGGSESGLGLNSGDPTGNDGTDGNVCSSNYSGGDDFIYEYTATTTDALALSLWATNSWTGLMVTEGCPTTGTCFASSTSSSVDENLITPAMAIGVTYYIQISTYPTPQSAGQFCLDAALYTPSPPPVNDTCVTATDLALETSPLMASITDGTTATEDVSCLQTAGRDVFYSILVPSLYEFSFNQVSNDFDSVHRVAYGATCPGDTELYCSDFGETTVTNWTNETGSDQTVFIVIEGYSDSTIGDFTIQWSLVAPPACPDVVNLSTTTAIDGSVALDWDDEPTATGYNYEIQPQGTGQGDASSLVAGTSMTSDATVASGVLTDGTDYTLYVQSDCGGAIGNYQSIDFSYILPPVNDTCTTATDLALETSPLTASITLGTTNQDETSCLRPQGRDLFYQIEVPDAYDFSFNQVSNTFDSVDRIAYGGLCPGDTELRCSDGNEFGITEWTNDTGSTQTVYIVIENYYTDLVGDFTIQWSVTAPPACPDVANLSAATQFDGSVSLDWDDEPTATGYNYEIQEQGTAQGDAGSLVTATSMTSDATVASGVLTLGSDYTLYVQSDCGGAAGNYQSIDFSYILPPVNDTCATATDLALETSPLMGSITDGTTATEDVSCLQTAGRDVFYSILVPSLYDFSFNQVSNDFDSVHRVAYGATCPGDTELYCSDFGETTVTNWTNETGSDQTVFIVIEGYGDSTRGDFTIQWSLVAPPACPDVVNLSTTTSIDGSVALDWDDEPTATGYNYEIQPQGTAQGDAGSLVTGTSMTSDATVASGVLTDGADYTLYVASDCGGGAIGDYQSLDFTVNIPPANDESSNAEVLVVGESCNNVQGTLLGGTNSIDTPTPTCASFSGPDVWYSIVAPQNGNIFIDLSQGDVGPTMDTGMVLYSTTAGVVDAQVACNDDGATGAYSSIIITDGSLTAGDTYLVRVWEYGGGNPQNFSICAYSPSCPGVVTTWNGTAWSPSVPTNQDTALISGTYDTDVDGNIDACSLIIGSDSGDTLNVSADGYINIVNDITNNGSLNVAHTGNVVQVDDTGSMTGVGTTTVSIDTPTVTSTGFVVLGSPVESDTREAVWVSAFNVQSHDTSLFVANAAVQAAGVAYNFAGTDFTEWSPTTGALNPAEGYLVRPQASYGGAGGSFTYDYDGTLNNGVVTSTLTYNGAQLDSPNILSNPYASAMDADLFLAANTEVDALYFWNHLTEPSAMIPGSGAINFSMEDISVYNDMGGVAAGNGGTAPTNVVSTAQGFGVFASSAGTATFNNSMRLTSGNTTLRSADAAKDRIWLNIFNEQYSVGGNTLVGFTTNATEGFDSGYDNSRLGTAISLYSHINSGDDGYSIQGREAFDSDMEVLLGFSSIIGEEALYVISITDLDGLAWDNNDIFLIDNLLNVKTQLNDTDYTFTSIGGTFNDRFTLVFVDRDVLGTTTADLNAVTLSPNPTSGLVNVVSPRSLVNSISITDIQGRIVNTVSVNGLNSYQLDMTSLRSAVYFVKVTTEAGTITKRLIKK